MVLRPAGTMRAFDGASADRRRLCGSELCRLIDCTRAGCAATRQSRARRRCWVVGVRGGARDESSAAQYATDSVERRSCPSIGLGTNNYNVTQPKISRLRRDVLRGCRNWAARWSIPRRPTAGRRRSSVSSSAEIGNRDKLFYATKVTARTRCRRRARDARAIVPPLAHRAHRADRGAQPDGNRRDAAGAGGDEGGRRIKYLGVTTSNDAQHDAIADAMRRHQLDFVQLNYSLDDREAAQTVAAARAGARDWRAREHAVRWTSRQQPVRACGESPLPDWATEIDATSWAQFFLKYVVSHPAVTCAIPGTTKVSHLEDNQHGGHGRLPDAACAGGWRSSGDCRRDARGNGLRTKKSLPRRRAGRARGFGRPWNAGQYWLLRYSTATRWLAGRSLRRTRTRRTPSRSSRSGRRRDRADDSRSTACSAAVCARPFSSTMTLMVHEPFCPRSWIGSGTWFRSGPRAAHRRPRDSEVRAR